MIHVPQHAHWYTTAGIPCHEVPKKDGSGFKATTVREARELGLLPSSTSILSIVNKYGLNVWKVANYVEAAARMPRLPGETNEAFAQRVIDESGEETFEAAVFGKRLHAAIAGQGPRDLDLMPYLEAYDRWAASQGLETLAREESFAALDYGGTRDWRGYLRRWDSKTPYVLDWTTQKTESGKKPNFYSEKSAQIASYVKSLPEPHKGATVVISYTEPGRIESRDWDIEEGWAGFQAAKNLYYSFLGPGYRLNARLLR